MYRGGGRGYRDDGPPPRRDGGGGYPPRGHPPHPGRGGGGGGGLRGPDLDPAIIREREINRERYLRERERERERFRQGPPGGFRPDDRYAAPVPDDRPRDRGWGGAPREHPDREREWARRDVDGDRFRGRDRFNPAMDRDGPRPFSSSAKPGGSTRDHSPEEGQIASPPPRTMQGGSSPPPRDSIRSGAPSEYLDASEGRHDSSPATSRAWGPGAARPSRDASPGATSRSRSRSPAGSVGTSDGRTPMRARRPSPPSGSGYFAQGQPGPSTASPAVRRAYGPGSANSTIPSGPRGMMGFSPHRGGGPPFGGGGGRGRGGWGARGGFAPPAGPRGGGPGGYVTADPPPRSLARKVDAEGMPLASDIPIAHLQQQQQAYQSEQGTTSEDSIMQRPQEDVRMDGGAFHADSQSQSHSQQDSAAFSVDSQPGAPPAQQHAPGQGQWTPVGSASSSHSDMAGGAAPPAQAPGPPPVSSAPTAAPPTASNPPASALQTPTRPGMAPPRLSFSQMGPNASLSKLGPAGSGTPSGLSTPVTPMAQTPGLGPQLGSRSQRASMSGTPVGPRGSVSATPTAPPRHFTPRDFPRSVAPDLEAELANLSAARLASVHTSYLSMRQPLRSALADLADAEVELAGAAAKVGNTSAALEQAKLGADGFIMEENRKESLREAGWAKGLFA